MDAGDLMGLIFGGGAGALVYVLLLYLKWNTTRKTERKEGELNVAKLSMQVMKDSIETLQDQHDKTREELRELEKKLDVAQKVIDELRRQLSEQEKNYKETIQNQAMEIETQALEIVDKDAISASMDRDNGELKSTIKILKQGFRDENNE